MTPLLILIGLMVVLIIINISAIWLSKKGLTKDENNNMIPDILEEKFNEMKKDVSFRVNRVGEELKDVTKAKKIMEDLKIYGISLTALTGTFFSEINPVLSTFVLLATLVYTVMNILEKSKKK